MATVKKNFWAGKNGPLMIAEIGGKGQSLNRWQRRAQCAGSHWVREENESAANWENIRIPGHFL